MRLTLVDRTRSRFSETARSRPGSGKAGGDGSQVRGSLPVRRGRFTDDVPEGPAEGAEAAEADIEADLAHARVALPQEEHRSLHAAALQVAMGRFAECGAKGPDEVSLGYVSDPREGRDVEPLRVLAVHCVTGAQHAAVRLFDGSAQPDSHSIVQFKLPCGNGKALPDRGAAPGSADGRSAPAAREP